MLRAGKKLLIEVETQGRKAIERLHPAGSAAAAAAAAVAATPLLSNVLLSPALTPGAGTPGITAATSVPPGSASALLDAAAAAPQPDPLLLEDPEEAGYSSFDDEATDLEDDDLACVHGSVPAGLAPRPLLQLAGPAALRQPWSLACPGTAGPSALPLSREWRAARAGVDWRARWLELRLRELHHQRARYQEQLAAAEAAEAQAAAAAAAAQQAPPPPPSCEPEPRRQVPELALPALLEHPFFAEQLGAKRQRLAAQSSNGDAAAALGAPEGQRQQRRQQMALAEVVNDPNYPARAHAALQLLDRRLALLRRQLVALQSPAAVAAGAPAGRLASSARLSYMRGMAPRRNTAGLPRMRSGFSADSETRAMKRRRAQEAEVAELLQGQSILLLPKFVERTNVSTAVWVSAGAARMLLLPLLLEPPLPACWACCSPAPTCQPPA